MGNNQDSNVPAGERDLAPEFASEGRTQGYVPHPGGAPKPLDIAEQLQLEGFTNSARGVDFDGTDVIELFNNHADKVSAASSCLGSKALYSAMDDDLGHEEGDDSAL